MKRGLSSFDIYVIVSELQDIIGSYIDKIYQITRNELLIRINNKKNNQTEFIFIRNGELLCTTQKRFDVPKTPSVFAMTMRKYLLNGQISGVLQHEFDRIIKLKIRKKEGEFILVFELFANGNIILVNPKGEIILPLIKQQWAHRSIRSNEMYVPPPSQINPFNLTMETFLDFLKKSKKDIVRTLAVDINLSGAYAEEICFRAAIDKNSNIDELGEDSIKKIYFELQELLSNFKNKKFQPTLVKIDGKTIDILPIPFESYKKYDFEKTDSFCKGLQEFVQAEKPIKLESSKYQKKIEKLQRQLTQQEQTIEDFRKKIKQKKIEGGIIYLNFQVIQDLLGEITLLLDQKEKKEGIQQINKNEIVKSFDPISNELIVTLQDDHGNNVELELDFRKTVSENAESCYNASKKFQEKLKGAQEALEQTKISIRTMEEKNFTEKKKEIKREKQFWFERFRWFVSTDGNIVIGGRDAKSNELIVKKYLKEGDRYVHADIHGAPSCIVKSLDIYDKKISISEKTLEEACIFAASYSRAWNQFGEAQAYWVLPEQVSKTPESGEFIPKGAFVIRGKRNYYRCKLEIAVGEININDISKIMGGPIESVKTRTDRYVILESGVTKKSVIANKLSKVFDVYSETIERALPPGNVTIVKTVGFELK